MGHLAVSDLADAHPGGELLFSEISFRLAAGQHVGSYDTALEALLAPEHAAGLRLAKAL